MHDAARAFATPLAFIPPPHSFLHRDSPRLPLPFPPVLACLARDVCLLCTRERRVPPMPRLAMVLAAYLGSARALVLSYQGGTFAFFPQIHRIASPPKRTSSAREPAAAGTKAESMDVDDRICMCYGFLDVGADGGAMKAQVLMAFELEWGMVRRLARPLLSRDAHWCIVELEGDARPIVVGALELDVDVDLMMSSVRAKVEWDDGDGLEWSVVVQMAQERANGTMGIHPQAHLRVSTTRADDATTSLLRACGGDGVTASRTAMGALRSVLAHPRPQRVVVACTHVASLSLRIFSRSPRYSDPPNSLYPLSQSDCVMSIIFCTALSEYDQQHYYDVWEGADAAPEADQQLNRANLVYVLKFIDTSREEETSVRFPRRVHAHISRALSAAHLLASPPQGPPAQSAFVLPDALLVSTDFRSMQRQDSRLLAAMPPSNLPEATGEERTTTHAEELDDVPTLAEELNDAMADQRDARIGLLQQLCGEYLKQVKTYKCTVKEYEQRISDTLDLAAVSAQRLHEQIPSKEQAGLRDLVEELANKKDAIRGLYEQANWTTHLTTTAEDILHSEIQALKETVVQQPTQISSLEEEIDRQSMRLKELSTALSTQQADLRELLAELENKEEMIRGLREQADEILRSEIQALNETVVQESQTLCKRIKTLEMQSDSKSAGLEQLQPDISVVFEDKSTSATEPNELISTAVLYCPEDLAGISIKSEIQLEDIKSLEVKLPDGGAASSVHSPYSAVMWVETHHDDILLKSMRTLGLGGPIAAILSPETEALVIFGSILDEWVLAAGKLLSDASNFIVIIRPLSDDPSPKWLKPKENGSWDTSDSSEDVETACD
ncbi:hypothetical protein B0H16DRAFT_1737385 [Mycena metata]|uniref:Uncharacterized protein n=1 Tax=Mycena metata TaxID=1033252 RepID=A0AAD7MLU1_9AGAR|nr:hypothetical protein B0H16DRAFT_1737385 [Mycena metata]